MALVNQATIYNTPNSINIPSNSMPDDHRADICDQLSYLICKLQQDGTRGVSYSQILDDEKEIDALIDKHQDLVPQEVLNDIDPFFDRLNTEYQITPTFPKDLMESFFQISGSCIAVSSLIKIQDDLQAGDLTKLRFDSQSIFTLTDMIPALKDSVDKIKQALANPSPENIEECMDAVQSALDNI